MDSQGRGEPSLRKSEAWLLGLDRWLPLRDVDDCLLREAKWEAGGIMSEKLESAELDAELEGALWGLMAHDLRNPLAALASNVGFLGMLQEELSDDAREAIQDLQLSLEVLSRMTDAMELRSHELRRSAPPALGSVGVASVLNAVAPEVERAALSHSVRWSRPVLPESLRVRSAVLPLTRALSSLLHNSIAHAPPRTPVELEVIPVQGALEFRVTDRGAALGEAWQEAAFSAKGQVQAKGLPEARYSRGLGLYAAARAASQAGAQLQARTVAQGSCIVLSCQLMS